MSFWGKLFGTDKALTATVDAVRDSFDALVYTDEEKARDRDAQVEKAREAVVGWMQATQGQNLARRLIALTITTVWVGQYLLSMVGDMIEPWIANPDIAVKFGESATAIASRAEGMNGAMMLVLGFYFAAPQVAEISKAALEKFGSR